MKVAVLLALAAVVLFLIVTLNVQQTAADCDCTVCHNVAAAHGSSWQGCASCHGFPPATGSHLAHFLDSQNVLGHYQPYGSLNIAQDYYPDPNTPAPSYMMSCGNCHPMDSGRHQNGLVDVELYNPAAPAGSLKAKNLPSARYTPGNTVYYDTNGLPYTLGTCSDVYCHSYNDWTTPGGVPAPWPQNANDPPVPPNTVTTRYYQTPTWGESLACTGCHGNPPRTTYYTNAGGSGNSHSWLDDYNYEDLHNYNMGAGYPLDCKTCHNNTVKDPSPYTWLDTYQQWYYVVSFGDSSIANHAAHVNGTVDVVFDRVGTYPYFSYDGGPTLNLADAQFDPSTKTCSNVSCHLQQTSVTWGMPYRYWDNVECNRCHGI